MGEHNGFALSADDLVALAERASWTDERCLPPFEPLTPEANAAQGEARYARWRELAAKGNDQAFHRILAWRGIDPARWRQALLTPRLRPGAPLPAWVVAFARLMTAAGADAGAPSPPALARLPWAALFVPFATAVSGPLRARCDTAGMSPDVAAALETHLILGLCEIAGRALTTDIDTMPEVRAGIVLGNPPRSWEVIPGGAAGFFMRYPVLARLTALRVDDWLAALEEFFDRLAADGDDIRQSLLDGEEPGPLVGLNIENADAHDGSRVVMLLTFDGGHKLVYKPRSLALDVGFARLIAWLHDRGLAVDLRVPHVIDRGSYGWCEFITHRKIDDAEMLAVFYRRAGELLALAYALGASDLHFENLIADGDRLVPIDLETVLQPVAMGTKEEAATTAGQRLVQRASASILGTGLPPNWERSDGPRRFDIGGLGDPTLPGRRLMHRPSAGSIEPILARHGEDIAAGFRELYLGLMTAREALLAPSGPLSAMAGMPVRILLRDTRIYVGILYRSLAADAVGDGGAYEVGLERLARVLCAHDIPPPFLPLIKAEKDALRGLDVPRFTADTDSLSVTNSRGVAVSGVLAGTVLDHTRERLTALSQTDLTFQLRILWTALQARIAGADVPVTVAAPTARASPRQLARQCLAAARSLAERIEAASIEPGGGVKAWLGLGRESIHDPLSVTIADPSLAYGVAGVGLFYAALHRVDGDEATLRRFEAVLAALRDFAEPLTPADFYRPPTVKVGMASGHGGLVYALTAMARILKREDLVDLAIKYAMVVTPEAIATETELNVHSGLAGAVLGMAALHRLRPELAVAERLRLCGERLLVVASASALGAMKPHGLLGGPAGVALAALKLKNGIALAGSDALVEQALELERDISPGGWGEGGAGIALIRMSAADVGSGAAPDHAMLDNLARTRGAAERDDLANGRAGIGDALREVGRRLGRPELMRRGDRLLAEMVARSPEALRLLPLQLRDARPVGLFNSFAGIGYQCLRRVAPEALPFLLLFE